MCNLAYETFHNIKNLSAFCLPHARKEKINQHLTRYTFEDNSILELYTSGKAIIPHILVGEYKATQKGK